jgi:hypothetical protein
MRFPLLRQLALAGCLLLSLLGCGSSEGNPGGGGGDPGVGGVGGAGCNVDDVNACLDLLNCCRLILTNPVFFRSCESVALLCDADRCEQVLAGYTICSAIDL